MVSFSVAASLGPIVLSKSGQDSIYMQLKNTFLQFDTKEHKDLKRNACLRSLSLDCPSARCREAAMTAVTHPKASGADQEAAMSASTRSHSRSSTPENDNDSCSVCTVDSFDEKNSALLTPSSWDVSKVASIPSFIPPPSADQWALQGGKACGGKGKAFMHFGEQPTQKKNESPKKDLSKLFKPVDATQITTVMVRGIPCSFSHERMIQLLDEAGLAGKFNFFYLPYAGKSASNLGYAFVNFVDSTSAAACATLFDGVALDPERSTKFVTVTPADIQGLDNLRKHFRRSAVSRSTRGPMFFKV